MRLHLLSLPHTQANSSYLSCAYTQKVVKFCAMMGERYEIILYAGDRSDVEHVKEIVPCVTEEERSGWFGDGFNTVTSNLKWDEREPYWTTYAKRAVPALFARAEPKDLLLVTGGSCQKPISDALGNQLLPCEWAVGYEGIYADRCAFESYAWMHHVYGLRKTVNGRAFDQVIPNYFDVRDFLPARPDISCDPYLLYLGRVTQRKGPHVAGMIAKRLGMRLIVAGPGAKQERSGAKIVGDWCEIEAGDVEYVGEVGKADRAELLAGAACTLLPTFYIEPFGGVAIEALMSGSPVVASDWGAFTETITPDLGRRFRTLKQGCQAVTEAMTLDRAAIARRAKELYSLEAVGPRFDGWFEQIGTLWGAGWDA